MSFLICTFQKDLRGIAQYGRAFVWGTKGHRFKSGYPDQFARKRETPSESGGM